MAGNILVNNFQCRGRNHRNGIKVYIIEIIELDLYILVVSTTSAATAVFPAHVLLLTVVLVMID